MHGCVVSTVATDALVPKAPGRPNPQYWLNIHHIWVIVCKIVTLIVNNIKYWNYILEKIIQLFKVNDSESPH